MDQFVQAHRRQLQEVFGTEQPVAFVTGSRAPRVGRAIAMELRRGGFNVVTHGHRSANAESHKPSQSASAANGTSAVDLLADSLELTGGIEDEANHEEWLHRIMDRYGRIDVLVNSAAIWDPKPLEMTGKADYEHFFQVNTLGTAMACKTFGLQMTHQSSGGSIINIGDWAVARPYRDFAAYMASKGSIPTMTRAMAVEFATRNPRVRVNSVLPGPVLLDQSITEERTEQIRQSCLLKRQGTAGDVARAVAFLVASPFITGVNLPVDGGRSIYAGDFTDTIAHPDVS
ncbi:MAG: SDR family NAD(P)-dependent oxidoreductase [Aureliella sp.]